MARASNRIAKSEIYFKNENYSKEKNNEPFTTIKYK